MDAAMRKVGALCAKDFTDMFRNPSMLISLLMPIGFAVLFRFLLGSMADQATEAAPTAETAATVTQAIDSFLVSSVLCMAIGMIGSMSVVYAIAEEKEKHTLRTLMLANVSGAQIVASRSAVALASTLVVAIAGFFALGTANASVLPGYLALCVLGALPVILISLVLGLASRDQMTAGLYSVPVVLVSLGPMFGMYNESVERVTRLLPTGGMNSLVQLLMDGRLLTADALAPLAVTLAWTVGAGTLFAVLFRRLIRDN